MIGNNLKSIKNSPSPFKERGTQGVRSESPGLSMRGKTSFIASKPSSYKNPTYIYWLDILYQIYLYPHLQILQNAP